MKHAVRAIVVRDGALLVMHRNKFGHQYYTLVGGSVNHGESPEQALFREIQEETSLQVANPRKVFEEDAGPPYGLQSVYVCDYIAGEITLQPSSEEAQINRLGRNLYTPVWLSLEKLSSVEFLSKNLQQYMIQSLREGWLTQPTLPHEPASVHSV